jgi:EAL domain-containing protein (putative c-di-GMP-specific phosphodiesterase class I)
LRAGAAHTGSPTAAPTPANSRAAPTLAPVPSRPVADIEVLAFDPTFSFPAKPTRRRLRTSRCSPSTWNRPSSQRRRACRAAAGCEGRALLRQHVGAGFQATASCATCAGESGDVLVRVIKATPGFLPELPPASRASPFPASRARSAATPQRSPAAPVWPCAAPVAKAPVCAIHHQTTALPVLSDAEEVSGLINDTGPVPKLDLSSTIEPTIEPAAQLPPLEPLSLEESATDLTLFAQELIKLRSSGRTRRYEVLARSQRDANRNEVPAAFLADSVRGKDGAALDSMVVERLLTWLGQHGEAIWDSEPASFSVNVSIGAIEDETFPQRVEQWLEKHSVPAEYIGFEISEFACVQSNPAVQRFTDAIEKMGCFWVIDNFSLDSSVFELLGSKALRHVKVDPKLTAAAMKDKPPQALVVAICRRARCSGVHCVAKRIESQSAMQWLTAVGCDFAQSFTATPLPSTTGERPAHQGAARVTGAASW